MPAPRVVCGRAAARRAHSARFIPAPSTDCFYIFVQAQPAGEGKGQMRAHVRRHVRMCDGTAGTAAAVVAHSGIGQQIAIQSTPTYRYSQHKRDAGGLLRLGGPRAGSGGRRPQPRRAAAHQVRARCPRQPPAAPDRAVLPSPALPSLPAAGPWRPAALTSS